MRVGILTAGGDCPGLNAVIRAAAKRLLRDGHEPIGLLRGYAGLCEPEQRVPLAPGDLSGILQLGGTILQPSSFDPYQEPDGLRRALAAQERDPLDAIIAIGGDHTQMISRRLCEDGLPVIGVPKTIDNDVVGTDRTFGVDTAVQVVTDAIDRLRTTARSHDRVMVVEVMGRDSGWIATLSGIASGAEEILVPERERTLDDIAARIRRRHETGRHYSIVVVAEGARIAFDERPADRVLASEDRDQYGYVRLGGIGTRLAHALEQRTGYDTRVCILGHLQRGGTPVATDRILATRYGLAAAELAIAGTTGRMVALRGGEITSVPLADTEGTRPLDLALLDEAELFLA